MPHRVNFYTCAVSDVGVAAKRVAHAVLMATGMGLLLPIGVSIARFGRVTPPTTGPDAFWFKWHKRIQVSAVVLAIVGFALALAFTTEVNCLLLGQPLASQ